MQAVWIRGAAVAAACLCATAMPRAQGVPQTAPPNDARTGVIAGRIVDAANDQPIAGATILVLPQSRGRDATEPRQYRTDASGRFVFSELGTGMHSFLVQRPGYIAGNGAQIRPVDLADGQRVLDVVVRLRRLGTLAGTIFDENSDPVVGMIVTAYRRVVNNGQLVSLPAGEGRTDDRGAYRIAGVASGEYVVCACRRDLIPFDGILLSTLASAPAQLIGLASRAVTAGADVASIDGMKTYAPAFYPSGLAMSQATRITLSDGEERANIDIGVSVVRASRISGRIIGAPGSVSADSIRMRLAGEVPDAVASIEPMLVQPDGRFDFANIPPGSYVITAQLASQPFTGGGPSGAALAFVGGRTTQPSRPAPNQNNPAPAVLWGQAAVTIGDTHVSGVTIALRQAARVVATIQLPASMAPRAPNAPPPVRGVQLTPLSLASTPIAYPFNITQPDGTMVISGVAPGRYGIVTAASAGLRFDKATLGGADVTDMPIDVGETDVTDLVLTFSAATPTKVSGTAAINGDQAVLFFPADRRYWVEPAAARRRYGVSFVKRDGTFLIETLPPGDYLMALVPDAQAVDWQIQARIEALAPRAQRVTVTAGETRVGEVKR
jgi:hypothetical protein